MVPWTCVCTCLLRSLLLVRGCGFCFTDKGIVTAVGPKASHALEVLTARSGGGVREELPLAPQEASPGGLTSPKPQSGLCPVWCEAGAQGHLPPRAQPGFQLWLPNSALSVP